MVSGPWQQFTSNSLSFTNSSTTSGTFTLLKQQTITTLRAFNGGTVASTVTISCPPNPARTFSVPVGSAPTLITGWATPCSLTTLTSSNAWNTNFDDIQVNIPDLYTATPTLTWAQSSYTNTDGYRVYWRHPGETAWRGFADLAIVTDEDNGLLFYPGISLDWPLQRLIPSSEQNVEVEIVVRAYNKTTGEESNDSAPLTVCMPPLQPCPGCAR